ncbi:unnamed protein product [Vitrella brassicaformis CCMP3155]|uniref:Uncharacterized protein n=3 Tax=Vitrella brassicaformis TaxID=1169539 RepID=A0A0G4EAD1_VITBC|nr:unnamed protein product [Vitrella brassicaformis CCMP3155]|eukprot:CEL92188.1 unnamed protein product [Vitrella brassicaformis CCMP3155]
MMTDGADAALCGHLQTPDTTISFILERTSPPANARWQIQATRPISILAYLQDTSLWRHAAAVLSQWTAAADQQDNNGTHQDDEADEDDASFAFSLPWHCCTPDSSPLPLINLLARRRRPTGAAGGSERDALIGTIGIQSFEALAGHLSRAPRRLPSEPFQCPSFPTLPPLSCDDDEADGEGFSDADWSQPSVSIDAHRASRLLWLVQQLGDDLVRVVKLGLLEGRLVVCSSGYDVWRWTMAIGELLQCSHERTADGNGEGDGHVTHLSPFGGIHLPVFPVPWLEGFLERSITDGILVGVTDSHDTLRPLVKALPIHATLDLHLTSHTPPFKGHARLHFTAARPPPVPPAPSSPPSPFLPPRLPLEPPPAAITVPRPTSHSGSKGERSPKGHPRAAGCAGGLWVPRLQSQCGPSEADRRWVRELMRVCRPYAGQFPLPPASGKERRQREGPYVYAAVPSRNGSGSEGEGGSHDSDSKMDVDKAADELRGRVREYLQSLYQCGHDLWCHLTPPTLPPQPAAADASAATAGDQAKGPTTTTTKATKPPGPPTLPSLLKSLPIRDFGPDFVTAWIAAKGHVDVYPSFFTSGPSPRDAVPIPPPSGVHPAAFTSGPGLGERISNLFRPARTNSITARTRSAEASEVSVVSQERPQGEASLETVTESDSNAWKEAEPHSNFATPREISNVSLPGCSAGQDDGEASTLPVADLGFPSQRGPPAPHLPSPPTSHFPDHRRSTASTSEPVSPAMHPTLLYAQQAADLLTGGISAMFDMGRGLFVPPVSTGEAAPDEGRRSSERLVVGGGPEGKWDGSLAFGVEAGTAAVVCLECVCPPFAKVEWEFDLLEHDIDFTVTAALIVEGSTTSTSTSSPANIARAAIQTYQRPQAREQHESREGDGSPYHDYGDGEATPSPPAHFPAPAFPSGEASADTATTDQDFAGSLIATSVEARPPSLPPTSDHEQKGDDVSQQLPERPPPPAAAPPDASAADQPQTSMMSTDGSLSPSTPAGDPAVLVHPLACHRAIDGAVEGCFHHPLAYVVGLTGDDPADRGLVWGPHSSDDKGGGDTGVMGENDDMPGRRPSWATGWLRPASKPSASEPAHHTSDESKSSARDKSRAVDEAPSKLLASTGPMSLSASAVERRPRWLTRRSKSYPCEPVPRSPSLPTHAPSTPSLLSIIAEQPAPFPAPLHGAPSRRSLSRSRSWPGLAACSGDTDGPSFQLMVEGGRLEEESDATAATAAPAPRAPAEQERADGMGGPLLLPPLPPRHAVSVPGPDMSPLSPSLPSRPLVRYTFRWSNSASVFRKRRVHFRFRMVQLTQSSPEGQASPAALPSTAASPAVASDWWRVYQPTSDPSAAAPAPPLRAATGRLVGKIRQKGRRWIAQLLRQSPGGGPSSPPPPITQPESSSSDLLPPLPRPQQPAASASEACADPPHGCSTYPKCDGITLTRGVSEPVGARLMADNGPEARQQQDGEERRAGAGSAPHGDTDRGGGGGGVDWYRPTSARSFPALHGHGHHGGRAWRERPRSPRSYLVQSLTWM